MKRPKGWKTLSEARSPFRATLSNTAMLIGGRGVTGALSLVYVALAARSLGVEGFGLLTLVHAYAQTIGDFVEFNSWQAVLHYGVRPLRDGRIADLFRVIRFSLLLDLLGAVGGTIVALALAYFFAGPLGLPDGLLVPAMLYATSILFMSSTTPLGVLRLMDRFDLVAIQTTITSITRFAGSLVVFLLGGGLGWWLLVWYMSILAAFLFMIGAATLVMRGHGGQERFLAGRELRPFTKDMPGAWAFVWNINVSSSLGLVTNKIALLAVGFFLGARDAAFFRIAKQLADGATRPAKLLVPALYPELAKLWLERDLKRLTRLSLQVAATAGLVATSVLLVLALFGEPLITLFVGPDFLGATAIMLWLFGASVVMIWALPLEPLLVSTGRSGSALRVRAAVAVVYLAAVFPLMDRMGLAGAGIAALAAAILQMALQLLAVIRAKPGSAAAAPAPEELALPFGETLDNGPAMERSGTPAVGMNEFPQSTNGEALSDPGPSTLTRALERAAETEAGLCFHSGKGVLVETLSYARLRDEARALARRLLALGLSPGARVAILAETEADFPRAFFACRYAGLVPAPMPLPAAFGGREAYLDHLRRMVDVAEASAALGPASLNDWLKDAVQGRGLAFAGTLADLPPADENRDLPPPAEADDLGYLQFSSGSTRFPVGVAVTEKALAANALAIIRHGLRVRDGDRCVSWLPFYHDMGLVGFCLVPVFAKLSVDYLATRDFARRPLLWLDLISRNGGTISYAPSFGYDLCVRRLGTSAPPDGLDLSAWRAAGIGGDMIRPEILDRFASSFAPAGFGPDRFVASYGMAETVLALSFAPLATGIRADRLDLGRLERDGWAATAAHDGAAARAFVRCGPALPGHALEVRGENGGVLPEGAVGRIFAAGPSMMEGYYRNGEATGAVLSTDGWLDTGDLGYVSGGEIVVTGRAKDLIIVNGRNIWPQDLELTAEAEVEGLKTGDVAAFSLDSAGEEHVVVLVECRPSDPDARTRLSESVEKTLRARHGVDVEVALVKPNALPLTSSGKLSRTKARELYRRMRSEAAAGSTLG